MPKLVNFMADKPQAVPIWGFHGPCSVRDVAAALNTIGAGLSGEGHVIHIMSGTHGYCGGPVGAVATREQKFAAEDRALAAPKTKDNKSVTLTVHDFNTGTLSGTDKVAAALSKLNGDMRSIVGTRTDNKDTFLLAYCCSAGVE